MAKINEAAKAALLKAWDEWAADEGLLTGKIGGAEAFRFFNALNSERSSLLDFRSGTADKWQTVHGWLLNGSRVLD